MNGGDARRDGWALVREAGLALGAYVKGQLIISLILAVLYTVAFFAVGLPLWWLLGPLSGFLNFIPYFGFLAGMFLSALTALLAGLSFNRLIAVVLVYVAVSALESYWLTPRILGRRLGLRPIWVFLTILFAGFLFGFPGLLLAVPALAVALAVHRFYSGRS